MPFAKTIAAAAIAVATVGTASAAFAGAALTTTATKLYDGPVAGATVVATVAPGARIGVLWCGMHGEWCLVTYHAKQGFAVAAALKSIGGQLAVGAIADANRASGANFLGSSSSTGPVAHLVTGAGTLSLGTSPGSSHPVANIVTKTRP